MLLIFKEQFDQQLSHTFMSKAQNITHNMSKHHSFFKCTHRVCVCVELVEVVRLCVSRPTEAAAENNYLEADLEKGEGFFFSSSSSSCV